MHQIYILRCSDSSLYIGYTKNLTHRLRAHSDGRGAAHTAKHRPITLAYTESHPDQATALRRERQLKRWTRAKKEALISGDVLLLRSLARRRF